MAAVGDSAQPPEARRRLIVPYVILMLGLLTTAGISWRLGQAARRADALRFENMVLEVENRLRSRVGHQFTALLGGSALFGMEGRTTGDDLRAYVERLQRIGGLLGVQGLGFSRRVRRHERLVFERIVDDGLFPGFRIWPPGEREDYHAVVSLEPANVRNQAELGFDLATDPVRQQAMARARDTGEPTASGKVVLEQRADGSVNAGFVVFVPVYRDGGIPKTVLDRRERLVGYVYSPFSVETLLTGLVPRHFQDALTFSLYDGPLAAPERLMHRGQGPRGAETAPGLSLERTLPIGGHEFLLAARALPGFETSLTALGALVGPGLGVVVTILLFGFTRVQTLARHQAEASARRLREAREEALGHLRSRDSFLSIASHELKTPLTALQLHVDGLLRGLGAGAVVGPAERDRLQRRLESVARQSRRLGTLINELLDVTRVTGGQLELHPEEVDLVELVQEIRARFEPEASRAGCALVLEVGTGDGAAAPLVGRWDRMRLDQVITNLLSNAVKYGAGKPIALRVRRQGDAAVICVTDHGMGIDPKDHDRIFERFERAVPERKFGGFGIGLWITRRIVEAMGGDIRVTSLLGQGATFDVVLPLSALPRPLLMN